MFAGVVFLSVSMALAAESYLLHRTYGYFGGGAMNRPFALSGAAQYLAFVLESAAYDIYFYGLLVLLLYILLKPLKLSRPASAYLVAVLCLSLIAGVVVARWKIYEYFKAAFNLQALKEVTAGDLTNLFSWVDFGQFVWVIVTVVIVGANLFVVKWLDGAKSPAGTLRLGGKGISVVVLSSMVLAVNHFVIGSQQSLRYGLESKLSYSAVNVGLDFLTDFDRDGYGPFSLPVDPDNFDAQVNPYAVDVPANGIDENGLAGDLPALSRLASRSADIPLVLEKRKNAIVIILETFRFDIVEKKLGGEAITPFLNKLAAEHFHTNLVYSNFGTTAASIQSVLSGSLCFSEHSTFLFEHFRNIGYATFGVSGQTEDWGDSYRIMKLSRLDGYYDTRHKDWSSQKLTTWERMNPQGLTLDYKEVNQKVFTYLEKAKGRAPFFMYINYQDLHYPYYHAGMEMKFIKKAYTNAEFFKQENRDKIFAQYANAAFHLDKGIQELFAYLEKKDLMRSTLVVIVGDHPDSFYENGLLGHAWSLDQYQRRTSLLLINGAGEIVLPLGQDEIRGIIENSLNTKDRRLVVRHDPDKKVFVLVGGLKRPTLLGWIGPDFLVSYDYRRGRFRPREQAPWSKPEDLDRGQKSLLKSLINKWESEKYLHKSSGEQRESSGE